ncbi:MAG TPA: hypothetical protein VFV38_36740 [Ktedonobacteraceae bacterium]|nr:hypothetical protein [Ktedonobacteraceae bacterium]
MTNLLEGWSLPLDETAQRLLEQAGTYVVRGSVNTSIIPILLAALTTPAIATHSILMEILKNSDNDAFISYVKSKIDDNTYLDDLDIYKQACVEIAREEQIHISDVLILWQIIEKSIPASLLFLSYGIDLRELQNALQEEIGIGQPRKPSGSLRLSREAIPPFAIPEIWRTVFPVILTRNVLTDKLKMIDPYMHSVTLNHLIGELQRIMSTQSNHVILFAGANGSVADVLKYILAYWIGQTEASIPGHPHIPEQLREYKLWEVSLDHFRTLARRRHLSLDTLLEYLKEEAVRRRAILLLTGFENIRRESSVWQKVREALFYPRGACIICVHVYDDIRPSDQELTLGVSTMIPVNAERMDSKRAIYEFIEDYHHSRWKAQGYTIAEDAFDSLFGLEKGIWISHRRKTWPYLGIDLVDDCIGTAQRGTRSVLNLARDAREAINDVLTKEAPFVSDATREQFSSLLEEIKQRIELLSQGAVLLQQNNLTVVTQALIEAQLFCRNNSEFHYPGIRPW